MPLLNLNVSETIDEKRKDALLKQLSIMVAECFNKPEDYVMVIIERQSIVMSGTTSPAAFASIKSIGGINAKNNKAFSQKLADFLKNQLGIEPDRVYINFTDIGAQNWGWNGSTFG